MNGGSLPDLADLASLQPQPVGRRLAREPFNARISHYRSATRDGRIVEPPDSEVQMKSALSLTLAVSLVASPLPVTAQKLAHATALEAVRLATGEPTMSVTE